MPVDRNMVDLKRFYSKLPFLGLYFFRCIGIRWYEMFSRSLQDYASSLLRFSLRIQILAQIDLNGGSSEKAEFLNRPLYWKLCSCISEKIFCNIKTYLATLNGNSCSVKQQDFSAFTDKPAPTFISQLRLSINHQIPNIWACITEIALYCCFKKFISTSNAIIALVRGSNGNNRHFRSESFHFLTLWWYPLVLLSCSYIHESRLRTIIIAGIFDLQMCESYTARKF